MVMRGLIDGLWLWAHGMKAWMLIFRLKLWFYTHLQPQKLERWWEEYQWGLLATSLAENLSSWISSTPSFKINKVESHRGGHPASLALTGGYSCTHMCSYCTNVHICTATFTHVIIKRKSTLLKVAPLEASIYHFNLSAVPISSLCQISSSSFFFHFFVCFLLQSGDLMLVITPSSLKLYW